MQKREAQDGGLGVGGGGGGVCCNKHGQLHLQGKNSLDFKTHVGPKTFVSAANLQ